MDTSTIELVLSPTGDVDQFKGVHAGILGGVDKCDAKFLGHTLADQTLPRPCIAVPN